MEEGKIENQVVSAVGNAWIVCRSKSHPGRIYYFNTVSGEAAWNLSEAEIEKAKKTTNTLDSQDAVFRKCPEPKDPPKDGPNQLQLQNINFTTPSIYNKQIINNKFPNETCTFSSNANVQYALASFNPWKMPHAPTFNANAVWEVPPCHQIFIAPTVAQPLNQAIGLNITNIEQQKSLFQTMSKRFGENNYGNITTPTRGIRKYYNNYNHRFQNQRPHYFNNRRFQNNDNSVKINDLRQKLSAKRFNVNNNTRISENNLNEDPKTSEDDVEEETQNTAIIGNPMEEINNENPQPKLDLKPLRDLALPEVKLDCWYIVADTSVLLSNIKYLLIVLESDDDCCLMIPQYVMTRLQALTFSSENTKFRARNAIRLLTEQFDAGSAFITSEESSQTEIDECTNVFNSCLYLAKGNNHVVLLSNEIDMLKYKYTTQIPIFTIPELKNLLKTESSEQCNDFKKISERDRLIKITVTNDIKSNDDVEVDHEIPMETSAIKIDDKVTTDMPRSKDNLAESSKCKVDAGVQTEHTTATADTTVTQYDFDDIISDTGRETNNLNSNNFKNREHGGTNCKKREIKLKRPLSDQQLKGTTNTTVDKKQFKWRRRKNTSSSQVEESNIAETVCLSSNTVHEMIPSTSASIETADSQNAANYTDMSVVKRSNICYSNNESSESSNSIKRYVFDRIIIEETSTSAISNTGSNVDSEILMTVNEQTLQSKESETKNVMFEITSHSMEEFLKMRSDEWVSRFVQIMEDVLTEILQQDPQFSHNDWPPPWTIREATHCIALKYRSCPDVVDAAYKLSNTLRNVSDNRGGINVNLKPSEYMEMYSYGVYMVDTLQDMHSCEDLQVASESLKELLDDIQNANEDCCQNESFVDYQPKITRIEPEHRTNDADIQQDMPHAPETPNTRNYNLRSRFKKWKITEQEKQRQPEVTFIRNINIEYSFFNSLNLQKKGSDKVDDEQQLVENCNLSKTVSNVKQNVYHEDDYKEEYNDYYSEDGDYSGKENEEFVDCDLEEDECIQSETFEANNTTSNQKFKYFVGLFLKEIRDTFGQVQKLCEGCNEDIKGSRKKYSIKTKERAQKAQILVEDLCQSLESILQREKNNPGNSIKNLLKTVNLEDFYLDDNMCAEYRSIIEKCKDQASTVLASIRLIINSMTEYKTEELRA